MRASTLALGAAALVALATGWALSGWVRRVCDSPSRWLQGWVVGLLCGLFATVSSATAGSMWDMLAFWALGLATGLLVASDLAVMRLPDPIMVVAYPAFAALLAIAATALHDWERLGRALLAGMALLAFYLVSALVFPNGMSLGDVKFAGLLGAYLGWSGWMDVLWGTLLAALLGGLVGLALIVSKRGDRSAEYPYGPMMAVGAWAAVLWLR